MLGLGRTICYVVRRHLILLVLEEGEILKVRRPNANTFVCLKFYANCVNVIKVKFNAKKFMKESFFLFIIYYSQRHKFAFRSS